MNTTGEGRNVAVERAASQCTAIESELLDFLKKSPVIKTPKGADTLRLAAMSEVNAIFTRDQLFINFYGANFPNDANLKSIQTSRI